jgi:hypothetical protein
VAADNLPTWPEIKSAAASHLDAARMQMSEAGDWLRSIDSPLTPGQARSAGKARRLALQITELIDQAQEALDG